MASGHVDNGSDGRRVFGARETSRGSILCDGNMGIMPLWAQQQALLPIAPPRSRLLLSAQTARLQESFNGIQTLYGEYKSRGNDFRFCLEGCQVPFNGTADPFVEFTEYGFRGFPSGE
jgi:hypothetical protein